MIHNSTAASKQDTNAHIVEGRNGRVLLLDKELQETKECWKREIVFPRDDARDRLSILSGQPCNHTHKPSNTKWTQKVAFI